MDQQLEYNAPMVHNNNNDSLVHWCAVATNQHHLCNPVPDCSVQFGWRGDDCVMVTAQLRVTSKGSTVYAPLVEYQASGQWSALF